jgi:hypothetical protein
MGQPDPATARPSAETRGLDRIRAGFAGQPAPSLGFVFTCTIVGAFLAKDSEVNNKPSPTLIIIDIKSAFLIQ